MKERLDSIVVRKGWADSRERASDLIKVGSVMVNALIRVDPSVRTEFDRVTRVESNETGQYVSRGGKKLKWAIDFFGLSVNGLRIVDLGASTGGFTDCLLREGAAAVCAVDVGKGLLDWRLRQDPRVTVVECANARYVGGWMPQDRVHGVVADLSFISLRQILPSVTCLLRDGGWFLPLVKPQFETAPRHIERGGILRDDSVRRTVLRDFLCALAGYDFEVRGLAPSALRGRKGNQEYFFLTVWKGLS